MSGARERPAATAVQATASAAPSWPTAATMAATTPAGASTRRAVSDNGCGTSVAANPTAQPTHSPTDASVLTGTSALWRASENAGPAVNGRASQQARRIHGKARRMVAGSTGGEIYGQIRRLRPERW